MPLSPTDFYAYSQATGAPLADTSEKRAQQANAVIQFRRQQLKPQQEEFNIVDTLAKTALAAGALAGGIGAYRALRSPNTRNLVVNTISPTEVASVRRAATNTPPPSKVVSSPAAVQPATVDLSEISTQMQSAVNAGDNQVTNRVVQQLRADPQNDLGKGGFSEFSSKVSAQEKSRSFLSSVARSMFGQEEQLEQSAKQFYDASDLLAVAGPPQHIINNLAKVNRQLNSPTLNPENYNLLKSQQVELKKQLVSDSGYVGEAVENNPQQLADWLSTGKVTPGLASRRTPILNYQYNWELNNIPEFERTARQNAYAQTGNVAYLDSNTHNRGTMGDLAFSRMLGVADPIFNEAGHIASGRLLHGEGEINLGGRKALADPNGDKNPDAPDYRYADEAAMGIVPNTGSEYDLAGAAGMKLTLPQETESAIKNFRGDWDQMIREGMPIQPRYAQVIVNREHLDMPMDWHQTATNQPFTAVPEGQTLRDRLPPAQVEAIEAGGSAMVEIPYQTRKAMAKANIHLATDPQTLHQARAEYHSFQRTGEVLAPLWERNVAPLVGSEPMEGRGITSKMLYGNLDKIQEQLDEQGTAVLDDFVVTGQASPNLTEGQRGKRTASNLPVEARTTPVYDIKYDYLSLKKGNELNSYPSALTPTIDPKTGHAYLSQVNRAEDMDATQHIGMTSGTIEQDHMLTQPFGVSRVVPEQLPPTNSSQRETARYLNGPRSFVVRETVRGPLQVVPSKVMGGNLKELRSAEPGEVPRQKMQELLGQAEQTVKQNPNLNGTDSEIATELSRLVSRHPNEGGLGLYIPALLDSNAQYEFMGDIKGISREQVSYGGTLDKEDKITGKAFPVKGTQGKLPATGTQYTGLFSTEPYVKMSPNKYGGPDEEFDYEGSRGATTSSLTAQRQLAATKARQSNKNVIEALRGVGTTRPNPNQPTEPVNRPDPNFVPTRDPFQAGRALNRELTNGTQLRLVGNVREVLANNAKLPPNPAQVAAESLERYMNKMKRSNTSSTSAVNFNQPELF